MNRRIRIMVLGFANFLVCGMRVTAMTDTRTSLIFPHPKQEIVLVAQDSSSGDTACGHVLAETDPLAQAILAELRLPFHRSVIAVYQCIRNFAGDGEGPNILFLSSEEGGFARRGITLREGASERMYPRLNFVDLVLDEEGVSDGDLDIFSHELGHAMMQTIWPDYPEGRSPKQHVSMGITDPFMAFYEGWGEHFQRLVYDSEERYRRSVLEHYAYARGLGRLWHSNMDRELRLNAVLQNDYIHRKLLPAVDTTDMSAVDLILLEHTTPIFDRTRLKNAQEMLACEGVLATLFYRITTDSVLQHNYQPGAFYDPFLLAPIPAGVTPEGLFNPLENVLLKSAYAWSRARDRFDQTRPLFLQFIDAWCVAFPEDREELLKLFLLTTVGRTVTDELASVYERMGYCGMIGNIDRYRQESSRFGEAFARLKEDVLAGRLALDANVGPELWVENKKCLIPVTLFAPEPRKPLAINLNTASVYDLASFPGMSNKRAAQVMAARDQQGYFRTVAEAQSHGFRP